MSIMPFADRRRLEPQLVGKNRKARRLYRRWWCTVVGPPIEGWPSSRVFYPYERSATAW